VADLIISFPEETPVVVLAAMGKTTNNLILVVYPFQLCATVPIFGFLVAPFGAKCGWLLGSVRLGRRP
jgi:hypothetical protein